MKYIFFIIIIILTSKYLYSKDLFNTSFHEVDFYQMILITKKLKNKSNKKISIAKILNQTLQR